MSEWLGAPLQKEIHKFDPCRHLMKFNIIENVFLLALMGISFYILTPELSNGPNTKAWICMIAIEFCGQEVLSNYNRWKIKNGL